jgi:hypothetical protein
MLPRLLEPDCWHYCAFVDSSYSSECFLKLINLGRFESLIHALSASNHPLSDAAKNLIRIKSAIRVCVEYFFGFMIMSMCGKLTIKIVIYGNVTWWGI